MDNKKVSVSNSDRNISENRNMYYMRIVHGQIINILPSSIDTGFPNEEQRSGTRFLIGLSNRQTPLTKNYRNDVNHYK